MNFNIRLFAKQVAYPLTSPLNAPARLTPRRIAILLFSFPIFTILKLSFWLGFAWDDLFYTAFWPGTN